MGWKLYEECFKNKDGLAMENPENVETDRFSDLAPGQIFYNVAADKSEHFTSPPKQYSEDTLLAAMETAVIKNSMRIQKRKVWELRQPEQESLKNWYIPSMPSVRENRSFLQKMERC